VIAYYVCTNFPLAALERTEERLQKTGVSYLLNAEQFLALRILSALLAPLLALWMLAVLRTQGPWGGWILLAFLVGFLLPQVWLKDTRKRREVAVIRAMPVYLDFITMSVEAGLNMAGALAQAMQKGPPGALRNELAIVLRDLRSGVTRAEALRRMSARLDIADITSFVNAVIQTERMGASLANVLRVQSEQRRNERFQRAEKHAMQAPVKLILPLILFIFPVTFIVLAFPIAMKFLHGGIL
jgi:tight adherence protein C